MSRYDACDDSAGCQDFLRQLARTANVIDQAWKPESGSSELASVTMDTTTRMCLSVLQDSKHKIVLAPITRLHSLVRSGVLDQSELTEAIQAMTGFFALWRGAFGSTHNIDRVYRVLMENGDFDLGIPPSAELRPLIQRSPKRAQFLQRRYASS